MHDNKIRPWMLEELNLRMVREQSDGWEVAVVPMGATEPHNHHLPYGTDFLTVREVAARACQAAYAAGARVIQLPTIPYGVDSNMLEFPLVMHVSLLTLNAMLKDLIRSLEHHKIHKLVLINGHGGNDLKPLLREWFGETPVFATVIDWWKVGGDRYSEVFENPEDHAGEMETSVGLELFPDLVAIDQMTDGATSKPQLDGVRQGWVQMTRPWHLLTTSSGSGDPRAATAEKGRAYLEIVTERLAQFLTELSDASLDPPFPFQP